MYTYLKGNDVELRYTKSSVEAVSPLTQRLQAIPHHKNYHKHQYTLPVTDNLKQAYLIFLVLCLLADSKKQFPQPQHQQISSQ